MNKSHKPYRELIIKVSRVKKTMQNRVCKDCQNFYHPQFFRRKKSKIKDNRYNRENIKTQFKLQLIQHTDMYIRSVCSHVCRLVISMLSRCCKYIVKEALGDKRRRKCKTNKNRSSNVVLDVLTLVAQ